MPQPIILQDLSGIAEGISSAGSSLSQALGTKLKEGNELRKQKEYGSILDQTIGQLSENPSALEVTNALSRAMTQGVPSNVAQNFGSLFATLHKSGPNQPPGPEQVNTMSTLFKKFGMEEDVAQRNAELWGQLTTGGQTEMAKLLVDQISRQQFNAPGEQVDFTSSTQVSEGPEGIQIKEKEKEVFKYPKIDVFEDRTPKERVTLKTELLKTNNVKVAEASESVRKKEGLSSRYAQLENLNDSGKLPEGLENLNINWTTGDIRFPKLANAETQAYVKAINDFTTQAKDTFGARVTNFELGAFMKRLPTLANNEAGRRIILDQMKLANEADALYDQALLEVYDHYGTQKIDFSKADKIAREVVKDETAIIRKKALDNLDSAEIQEARVLAPEGKVPVKNKDGKVGFIWRHEADKAAEKGFKIL